MDKDRRIGAFISLGERIGELVSHMDEGLLGRVANENPWFTGQNVRQAFSGIRQMLDSTGFSDWAGQYHLKPSQIKRIGVVMAGNVPMVGFHDMMSVLLSGHRLVAKLSSQDSVLMKHLISMLLEIEPGYKGFISIEERLKDIDCIIATGSDNSARYFGYYFSKYPHIIRKNRTSVAILTGRESEKDLYALGSDIFSYFGLGCRNISTLMVPAGYDFSSFFEAVQPYGPIVQHHKYANNYDYNKAILLVDQAPFLDNGFLLLRPYDQLVSPISVVHYQTYENRGELEGKLKGQTEKIQCIVGEGHVPFGMAQTPGPGDYADGVDTMAVLEQWGTVGYSPITKNAAQ